MNAKTEDSGGESRGGADALREIRLFGFRFNPRTGAEVVDEIAAAVAQSRRLIMANLNVHGMAMMFDSPDMARLLSQRDALVIIDSMPILFAANLWGFPLPRAKRATSLDFYDDMFRTGAARGWRFGYVGATEQILQRGLQELRSRFPDLDIDGHNGYFDIADTSPESTQGQIISWLKRRSHDVVIVGMGMPRQESWIAHIQDQVPTRVFLPTGAYLDYQVGAQRPTPRWIGQIGFEWSYRLVRSPRRLAYRYLIEPLVLGRKLLSRQHPQAGLTKDVP